MQLEYVDLRKAGVSDVTPITDLTPLAGMKLKPLFLTKPGVDLTPLAGTPLQKIGIRMISTIKGIEVLRANTSLKSVRAEGKPQPVASFWRRYDAGEFSE